ncbi:amino acid adenylation domain-containing protein [Actinomycetes bacterium KLBMP 9797]
MLSAKERSLWLLEQSLPGASGINNILVALVTRERLDVAAVRATVDHLARRHPALLTRLRIVDDEPVRVVGDSAAVPFELVEATVEEIGEVCRTIAARPIDLVAELPVRVVLARCPDRDVVCLCLHHLAVDAVSCSVLLREFAVLYPRMLADGRPPVALADPVPAPSRATRLAASAQFWRDHLAGLTVAPAALDFGRPDPDVPSFVGGTVTRRLSAAATAAMRQLRRQCRATDNIVLLALYYALLARHGAGRDLVVGVPVDLRDGPARRAVGYYMNTLPLRVAVPPERSFQELVREVRKLFVTAMNYADISYEELALPRPHPETAWWVPPFRHMFNFRPLAEALTGGDDELPFEALEVEGGHSRVDLELVVRYEGAGITLQAVHSAEIHQPDDIEALLARYEAVLERLPERADTPIGDLDVWSDADRATVAATQATAGRARSRRTVPALIADRMATSPDATAMVDRDGAAWSYQELRDWATGTAALLTRLGVGSGATVGLYAERGPACAAAALGAWLVGAAYLPLDPEQPATRLGYQLEDAQVGVLLADREPPPGVVPPRCRVVGLDTVGPAPGPWPEQDPGEPAYVIYTSGSTGLPKGVVISHANLANVVQHFAAELEVSSRDTLLWLTTFAFDISALEVFLPLVAGARVVVAGDDARSDGATLLGLVERYDVSVLQATPTTWRLVVTEANGQLRGRRVLCGGEPLPVHLAQALLATGCRLWNVYGPTETTIWSTSAAVTKVETEVPVGRPIANTTVVVVDGQGRDRPPGLPGEVCIGGDGVAIGYLNRPELTAQRFVERGAAGRHYRTGDVGRWRHDGTLALSGRSDRQVKLRGHRIELGEVEAVLEQHPAVQAAAVVLVGDPSAEGTLVAFVQPGGAGTEKRDRQIADEVWRFARERLASFMVPGDVVVMATMPTTGNEKVDYPALTALARRRVVAPRPDAAIVASEPEGLVGELVALWRSLLRAPDLDHEAHFFQRGGHSLLAAKLAQQVTRATGVKVSLSEVLAAPTPRALAGLVQDRRSAGV